MKSALITGITGQDGSYLAEFLLSKGYEVHGLIRRSATDNTKNINHLLGDIELHYGDLFQEHYLCSLIAALQPDEIYNLAAQSDVGTSFECPEYTSEVTGLGVLRLLEAVRVFSPESRLYQASTSEMFGDAEPPQDEDSPMCPRNPYGVAKLFAHRMVDIYRKSYNLHASCGILFNHESERRGREFVTQKICFGAARISSGLQKELRLGNLDAVRDWGYAPDYVKAMWLMLQQPTPDDYVIGTGEVHTVREFVEKAFNRLGLDWKEYVIVDPMYYRPLETNYLMANTSKAKKVLGWAPEVYLDELVDIMIRNAIAEVGQV